MKPQLTVTNLGGTQGNILYIPNDLELGIQSFFSNDTVPSATLYVENVLDLPVVNQLYLLGSVGTQNAEISTALSKVLPTSTTPGSLTFVSALSNRHVRGEPVVNILFNRIEISSSPTENGIYTVVSTQVAQVNSLNTIYVDATGTASTFYKVRYNNSLSGLFSDYSYSNSPSSYVSGSVGYMFSSMRDTLGLNDDPTITDSFLLSALNDARRIADREIGTGKMKEWRQVFEYPVKMLAGANYIPLPTDMDYSQTNRSLLAVRYSASFAGSSFPLQYVDKKTWNYSFLQRRYSTATTNVLVGAVTIVMANTGDFPPSGSIQFQAEDASQSILTVSYTANNKVTNTLTGVTGVTRNITAGSQGWAYQSQAYPSVYTVINGNLYFDVTIPQSMNGVNLYLDYYKALVDLVSTKDLFPEHYYDIYKNYLRFAIKRRRDDSIGENDVDYVRFLKAAGSVFSTDFIGQNILVV
jgi:hypothetical protein